MAIFGEGEESSIFDWKFLEVAAAPGLAKMSDGSRYVLISHFILLLNARTANDTAFNSLTLYGSVFKWITA